MLGDDCERIYDELINTLGNLTLTAYNSELSDAPFSEKKAHLKGGFDQDYLVISKELHDLDVWDEGQSVLAPSGCPSVISRSCCLVVDYPFRAHN